MTEDRGMGFIKHIKNITLYIYIPVFRYPGTWYGSEEVAVAVVALKFTKFKDLYDKS